MTKYEILKKIYGYDTFRKGQEDLIDATLDYNDVLGIMPTGAGKSVCFQIPALMFLGITIVISPLISLMKDQVAALNQVGVHAAYINSSLSERQIHMAMQNARRGQYKIIYVAPERLMTGYFQSLVREVDISMVVVDEAHCISQWGQDFRPSYLKINDFIKTLPYRPVIAAYTATATLQVREDILRILNLNDPKVVVTGYDRTNLYFAVRKPSDKYKELLKIIKEENVAGDNVNISAETCGIIYCNARKNVDEIYERLFLEGYAVSKYHAGMSDEDRHENQEDFIYDRKTLMVATNAFGMGIDKSNVRFVVHYNMPKDLESYYQEAGRAGRDGLPSKCILLYSGQDVVINKFLLSKQHENEELSDEERSALEQRDKERLRKMTFYCVTNECLRDYILKYFGEKGKGYCGNCENCQKEYQEEHMALESIKLKFPKKQKEEEKTAWKNKRSSSYRSSASKVYVDAVENEGLFEALKSLRMQISKEMKMPPYIIFTDVALKEMCRHMPVTKEEMLNVKGVGEFKYEKYGERFIQVIRQYK